MTKFKVIVRIEKAGEVVGETSPVFVFGIEEERGLHELNLLAEAVATELVGALQIGMRKHAAARGIRVWPEGEN